MNKKLLCSLLLGAFVITGCGSNTDKGTDNKTPKPQETKPDYSKLFTLTSPEDPACMVNPKVKEYTDKIYAQREAAGVSAEDENKIVDPLYADTVKIGTYKGDYDECVPVELTFEVDDSIKDETFKVRYWLEDHDDDYKEVDPVDGKVSLDNLFRSSTYEWKVISSTGKDSSVETFETGDYVRFLNVGNIPNFRDNGGWTTVDGKRIKQGMVYRGFELNDHRLSNGHAANISGDDDPAKDIFVKDLGIRVEVDLRSNSEADNISTSPMNKAGVTADDADYVTYKRHQISSYHNGLKNNKAEFKTIFEDYLANADEKPVYYHCYGGADRTGTIGFLWGAILGMSYTDLVIDYEATTFSNNLKEHDRESDQNTHFPQMIQEIKSWSYYSDNKPLSEVIEQYLVQDCGVSAAKIARIREISLEDID